MICRTIILALSGLMTFGLSACVEPSTYAGNVAVNPNLVGADEAENIATDHLALRSYFANKTIRSFDEGRGNQVEYKAADGTVWLWYPGNGRVLSGNWRTEPLSAAGGTRLCFRYNSMGLNPVTGVIGIEWECTDGADYVRGLREIETGDTLGLRQAMPFVLNKTPEVTLDSLRGRAS